jgi:hypothetical protein
MSSTDSTGRRTRHRACPTSPGYALGSITFDESGDAWAITNLYGNAVVPESHGVLLRFHDGQWRLQNWKVPFWRVRGWGLFG